jgi:hypothetical protein
MNVVWAQPRPLADPRVDIYWDVVPIPFYPDDLPDIEWEYLTKSQRKYVFTQQMNALFPLAVA